MKGRYTDIEEFNRTYGSDFGSWDHLLKRTDWREQTDYGNAAELEDNMAFMRSCVDAYYRKAATALRRVDKNHLFFGDKLNANTIGMKSVLDITCRYTDVVFYQMYARYQEQRPLLDWIRRTTDLPVINGDSAYSTITDMITDPYGPHASDQAQRAAWTEEFARNAFIRPEFVGWHMCGTIDTWRTMPGKDAKQHAGLKNPTGEYYPEMEQTVIHISDAIYHLHAGQ